MSLAWIPNALTAANVLLGFLSILVSAQALLRPEGFLPLGAPPFDTACWLILWATLFDVLDGKVAKLLGASSDFGMRLDTFADATTFGLAPAVLAYGTLLSPARLSPPWGILACGLYFTAAVYRLARYNVQGASSGFGFVGLPTPTAAMITVCLYLATRASAWPPLLAAAVVALTGLAMVSPLRYPAFKGLFPRERSVVMAILGSMALATVFFGPAWVVLAYFGSLAFAWGPWWVPTRRFWVPQLRGRPAEFSERALHGRH